MILDYFDVLKLKVVFLKNYFNIFINKKHIEI